MTTRAPGTVKWLTNANLIDVVTGDRLPDQLVRIEAGSIAEITAGGPVTATSPDQVLDLGGRWLLPGLISCHTHLSIVFPFSDTDEDENPALTAYRSATRAREALEAGVTTVRCVHEQHRADLWMREAVGRGWFTAPRILAGGRALSTPGGHGSGSGCVYVSGPAEFGAAAEAELAAGADHVKIFISGGLAAAGEHYDHGEMTDAEISAVVAVAQKHGKYVVAHSGGAVAIRRAVELGVRGFEHGYHLDDATAQLMAAHGVFLTPTLCVTRSESWMRARGFEEHTIANARNAAADHTESVRAAIRAGVTLVNGTDYPPGDTVDGVPAVVHEMLETARVGVPALDVLRTASVNAARLLGIEDAVGRLQAGFAADLIAVPRDPLTDLSALREISLVIARGRIIRDGRAA